MEHSKTNFVKQYKLDANERVIDLFVPSKLVIKNYGLVVKANGQRIDSL